jgi:iron complex outermembrane receptor protein
MHNEKDARDIMTHPSHPQRQPLRLKPLAAALSGLLCAIGAQAQAQQAQDSQATSMNTVVVSGVRHSIETSTATKRDADDILEAVSAEDIGKLPDVSIAESISRLPGVAAQNVNGRAQVIAIRGMSPDFAGTVLNGREQTSTGVNRGVEFDQYPAELMSSVVVYKTPDATLLGQGISGTVDMRTIRPLSVDGRKIALNARMEKNSLGDLNHGYAGTGDKGGRASVSYIDQYLNRTLGLAIGYAHLQNPGQEQHYKAWWWGAPGADWHNGATAQGGAEMEAMSRKDKRDGLLATLEYKPNATLHSTLDAYYSKFTEAEVMRGMMYDSNPWNDALYSGPTTPPNHLLSNVGTGTIGGGSVITSGTMTFPLGGTQPVVRNDKNDRNDVLASLGWNLEAKLGDWRAIADLSYSSAKRNEHTFETYAGPTSSSLAFNIPVDPGFASFSPAFNAADPGTVTLGDPGNWGHDGRSSYTEQYDKIRAVNLHARHKLGWIFRQLDAGVNFSARDKTQNMIVYFADLNNGLARQAIDPNLALSPTSLGFAGIPGVLSYDVNQIASQYYTMTQNMSGGPGGDYSHDFGVHERVTTSYAKANFETDVAGIPLHGNLGAQYVHTRQYSNAYAFSPSGGAPAGTIEQGTSYNNFLPSLNAIADLPNDTVLRLGLAQTLARPRIDDMNATYSASVDPTTHLWSGSGGNPKLRPWRANGADLSLEKYWGNRSYLAGALFYKKLLTYVYNQTIDYDFTGFVNPTPTVTPIGNQGTYSTQANGTGGNLRGAEVSGALDAGLINPMLDGFGAQFSYSYTDTSIKVQGPGSDQTPIWATLPGLSKNVAGLTLYYEKNGFSARINDRYRSSFRGEYASLFGATSVLRNLGMNTIDLQLGYEFQSGAAKGLAVSFQVVNLKNAPDRNVQDGAGFGGVTAPQEYDRFGRQFLLGLSYKL